MFELDESIFQLFASDPKASTCRTPCTNHIYIYLETSIPPGFIGKT